MASMGSGDVEIMVHTTAPSRGQDDARYRALTRAYMAFEPVTRQKLRENSVSNEAESLDGQANGQLRQELLQSTQEERESAASYRPDDENDASTGARTSFYSDVLDQLGLSRSLESPMLSFNSVLDNADSPVFRGLVTRDDEVSEIVRNAQTEQSSDSWRPPPSVIADSQPDNDRALTAFSSPAQILELYLQKLDSSEESSPHSGLREYADHEMSMGSLLDSRELVPNSFESSRILSSPSPDKRPRTNAQPIPAIRSDDAPSTQDPDLDLKMKWPESSTGEIQTSSVPARATNNSSISSEEENPHQHKRQRTELSKTEHVKTTAIMPSSNAVTDPSSSPTSTQTLSVWSKVLEIRPTPPITSSSDLTAEMFITDTLHQLASKMPAARLFRPVEENRDLRPMERGYWLVNCRSWNEELRSRCWNCLGNYIGKDLVGWGVWCIRDVENLTIRVYCWGIIVGHIYLLLYMASEGKIKGTSACWIGGDGEAIIKMPS
jgi:hypothetical protein